MNENKRSIEAADAIMLDLSDRRGVMEDIDDEVLEEIRNTIAGIISEKCGTQPAAPTQAAPRDECGANMNGHSFGPHGINGEVQCRWCAAPDLFVSEQDERALFEAWARKNCGMTDESLAFDGTRYEWGRTADMWCSWKARAALAQVAQAAQGGGVQADVEFKRLADTILQATTNGTRLQALRDMAELFDRFAAHPAPSAAPAQGEPVGEVILFGGDLKEISWKHGKLPPVGTKLYTGAALAQVAQPSVEEVAQAAGFHLRELVRGEGTRILTGKGDWDCYDVTDKLKAFAALWPAAQVAQGEPVAAQFKAPGETWEACSIDEEEAMLANGCKFRHLYAAPVAPSQPQDDATGLESNQGA